MAVQLSTSEQAIGYVEWDVNGAGSGARSYTRLYVRYAMESSTVARIYVRQVIACVNSGWSWSGTNNRYRTRCDGYYDSGYNTYGSGWNHSETQVWSGSFTVSNSSEYSLQCYAATYGGTYYGETWTGVYVPSSAFASPPTGLSVTNISTAQQTITGTVSITDWGKGANTNRYLELSVSPSKSTDDLLRRYQKNTVGSTSLSAVITCSNSSQGTLTIAPNTLYYIGAYSSNGSANTGVKWDWGSAVTKPATPTANLSRIFSTKAQFTISLASQGGAQTTTAYYRIKSSGSYGSYQSVGTIVSQGSVVFEITGLSEGTTYTLEPSVSSSSGRTTGTEISFKTGSGADYSALYVSVGAKARKGRLYCSVGGKARYVKKFYGSADNKAKRIL